MKESCFKGGFYAKAFTLIELLVVVLIIGILAAVALPQYRVAVTKSRYATLMNGVKTLANAAELAYLANGVYPDNLSELDISDMDGCTPSWNKITCDKTIYMYNANSVWRTENHKARIDGYLIKKDGEKGLAYLQYLNHSPEQATERQCSTYFDDTALAKHVCASWGGEKLDGVTWSVRK